jgi:hypothetical protein
MSEIKVVLGLLPSLQIIIGKEEESFIKDCARLLMVGGKFMIAPLFMEFDEKRKKYGLDLSKDNFLPLFEKAADDIRDEYLKFISKLDISTKKVHLPNHHLN